MESKALISFVVTVFFIMNLRSGGILLCRLTLRAPFGFRKINGHPAAILKSDIVFFSFE